MFTPEYGWWWGVIEVQWRCTRYTPPCSSTALVASGAVTALLMIFRPQLDFYLIEAGDVGFLERGADGLGLVGAGQEADQKGLFLVEVEGVRCPPGGSDGSHPKGAVPSQPGDDPPHDAVPLIGQHEDVHTPVYAVLCCTDEAAPGQSFDDAGGAGLANLRPRGDLPLAKSGIPRDDKQHVRYLHRQLGVDFPKFFDKTDGLGECAFRHGVGGSSIW
ncbi:hypothetical protein [Bosea sp. Root381]|uniref:hypothetical protein n=1 Tax=Bosea sp. Root381 TaxID=1736524 RepID=UPI001FCE1EAF|nr:hypothetical protein [Bosea sp. Root381]